MSGQNVYDKITFFDEYRKLRKQTMNANILVEKPAMLSLLPDLKGKCVLDLGCGYGEQCMEYKNRGARRVVGIDISQKMLAVATMENKVEGIDYMHLAMEDLEKLDQKFDVVCSSLAFHYVEDFPSLIMKTHHILHCDGFLIFSQEHPLVSAYSDTQGPRWEKNAEGVKLSSRLCNYCIEGEKHSTWFSEDIIRYHRTFSSIINVLTETGFSIEKILEPIPNTEEMARYPEYKDNYHRPDFLLIKARKRS